MLSSDPVSNDKGPLPLSCIYMLRLLTLKSMLLQTFLGKITIMFTYQFCDLVPRTNMFSGIAPLSLLLPNNGEELEKSPINRLVCAGVLLSLLLLCQEQQDDPGKALRLSLSHQNVVLKMNSLPGVQ